LRRRKTTAAGGRQVVDPHAPKQRYKFVALKPNTYLKVVVIADYLREMRGRCTIGEAIEYLVDQAGVPEEAE